MDKALSRILCGVCGVSERRLTRNAAQCNKCGVVLESKHRHDFKSCVCGNYVDGGLSYIRRGGDPSALTDLCEWAELDAHSG